MNLDAYSGRLGILAALAAQPLFGARSGCVGTEQLEDFRAARTRAAEAEAGLLRLRLEAEVAVMRAAQYASQRVYPPR